MSSAALRSSAVLCLASLFFTLAGCSNSSTRVCNAAGGNCCGVGTDLCVAPQFVYAANVDGQLSTFSVDAASGGLSSSTTVTAPIGGYGMAVFSNSFLYMTNPQLGGSGSISAWTLNAGTGTLTPISGSPFSLANSLPFGMAVDPAQNMLYVADADKIRALRIDSSGVPTEIATSPFAAGLNMYLAIDQQNRFLFAADQRAPGSVWAFTIDAMGNLVPVPGSPFPADPNASSNTSPYGLVVDATGSFLYVTLAGTNQVAAFSIAPDSGILSPVPGSPFAAGGDPTQLVLANKFLYVSNSQDGTISGYSIDASGSPHPIEGSPFSFHVSSLTTNFAGTVLYGSSPQGMIALKIGSTGTLSAIGSPVPFSPEAVAMAFVQ